MQGEQLTRWQGMGSMYPESAFTKANTLCPRVHLWSAPDGMSSECEVTEFLYALVRLLKPTVVLETGCFLGATSMAIGAGLKCNQHGRLVTCDTDAEMATQVRELARSHSLPIQVLHASSQSVIKGICAVDLAFIDSGEDRAAEVTAVVPKMTRFGVIALHDTAPHQWTISNEYFESLGLQCLYMNTPRGLSLFQRHWPSRRARRPY